MKLYIISNRLPVKAVHRDGAYLFTRSEGGLATGLHALHTRYEKHWIGWPGVDVETDEDRRSIREELAKMNFHPIFLTPEQIANYYEGYSNSTIWPLCHYFFAFTRYRKDFWEAYRKVNALFCEEILRRIEPDDIVWVQDYQLMLLPGLLREHRPALRIGYFHHIPFPSYELFRILPERAEILRGVLGADLVAFHTHDYMRHFIGTAERVLHIDFRLDETQIGNRCVRVDALPMGIDYAAFHGISSNAGAQPLIAKTREQFGDRKLILSVDRLDYSKGILHRLRGFGSFLERYPEYRGQATLAMVIVPSRDRVNSYADLKTEIDKEIGAINGRYSTMEWTPVRYFYHGFSFEELAAMYYVADVALVTPLRDGMNLVAKEYVAVKNDNPGVLILSEMAGAAVELADALPINPNDTEQIAAAIHRALTMPVEEQLRRIERMQAVVSTQTVNKWAADFMKELADVCRRNEAVRRKRLTSETVAAEIVGPYRRAKRRLLLFDYDGTLAPIRSRPEEAVPSHRLCELLRTLGTDAANRVVICSGRDSGTLEKWFGGLPVSLAAEHGAFYKDRGAWRCNIRPASWDPKLSALLEHFARKTPRSRIERKQTALAKRSLAYPRGATAVEYGDHGHSEPISGKDPLFAAGGKGYRAGMALPRSRQLAGTVARTAIGQRAHAAVRTPEPAHPARGQGRGDQVAPLHERLRNAPPAAAGTLRFHPCARRRHHRRRHVRGPAAPSPLDQGRQRFGACPLQYARTERGRSSAGTPRPGPRQFRPGRRETRDPHDMEQSEKTGGRPPYRGIWTII